MTVGGALVGALRHGRAATVVFVLSLVARVVLVMVATGAAWAVVPHVVGGTATTVMSASMSPRIQPGDVVVSLPIPDSRWHLGNVLLVEDPDRPDRLRLHRLHSVTRDGLLVLKGDANPQPDTTPVDPSAVRGVAVLRIPWIGTPVLWAREGRWAEVLGAATALAGLLATVALDRRIERTRLWRPTPERGGRGAAATATCLALCIALATASIGSGQGWAAYSATVASSGNTFGTNPCFSSGPVDGPTFFYSFSEGGSGTAITDDTGNGNTGALRSPATRAGTCASGDIYASLNGGSGGFAVYPTSVTASSTLTLEFWIKTSSTSVVIADLGSASTGNSGSTERVLSLGSTGRVEVNWAGTNLSNGFSTVVGNGQWHLVQAVQSGSSLVIYVDGSSALSGPVYGGAATGYWRFGGDSSKYVTGSLDNLALYPAALTAAQVSNHYSRGR